jgi:hypothetical protein
MLQAGDGEVALAPDKTAEDVIWVEDIGLVESSVSYVRMVDES